MTGSIPCVSDMLEADNWLRFQNVMSEDWVKYTYRDVNVCIAIGNECSHQDILHVFQKMIGCPTSGYMFVDNVRGFAFLALNKLDCSDMDWYMKICLSKIECGNWGVSSGNDNPIPLMVDGHGTPNDFKIYAEEDVVNNPVHYQGTIECIDCIQASMPAKEFQGYLRGNIMKYVYRYEDKNLVEDLKKARWYLDRLISFHEN